MKGSIATAGYVDITNNTEKEVKLTISKAAPFKAVETHETIEKDGRMSMRKIDHFSIPAKGALTLKPGGNHIMLFEPSNPVRSGDKINVEFMVNGKIEKVEFVVVPRMQHSTHEKHH